MDLHQNARSTPGLAAQSQQGGPPCCGRGAWRVCGSWSPLRPAVAINGPGRGAAVVGLLPIAPDGGTHRPSFLLSGTTCALEWPRSDLELEHESDTDRFLDRGRCVTAILGRRRRADQETKRSEKGVVVRRDQNARAAGLTPDAPAGRTRTPAQGISPPSPPWTGTLNLASMKFCACFSPSRMSRLMFSEERSSLSS